MNVPYWKKLRDPRWQRRRLERLGAEQFACQDCGTTEHELHVHHTLYRSGADPWDYADSELRVLCMGCHDNRHLSQEVLAEIVGTLGALEIVEVIAFAERLAAERK